ncbi:MAG: HepT-like ribonuclease domain-containing protein [Tepidisphaeraceae bacterium]
MPPDLGDRERFEHMLKAARDATSYVRSRRRADLDSDSQLLRALTNCVQEIGEAASRTTDVGRARAPALPWTKMVGMRHILVHAYFNIDADAVWKVVEEQLPALVRDLESALICWSDE